MIRILTAVDFTIFDPELNESRQGHGFVSAHLSETLYEITSPEFGIVHVPVENVTCANMEIFV